MGKIYNALKETIAATPSPAGGGKERGVIASVNLLDPTGTAAATGRDTAALIEALRAGAADDNLPSLTPEIANNAILYHSLSPYGRQFVDETLRTIGGLQPADAQNPLFQQALGIRQQLVAEQIRLAEEYNNKRPVRRLIRGIRRVVQPEGWGDSLPSGWDWE